MAFTKVSLTGTIDTIKGAFTAVNNLIDDLLSTSSGKGASQIGIEDSAGNMAATNVETALAEIYSDTASAQTLAEVFNENSATTTGLTWGYKAGVIRVDNAITTITASTISLTDDATNYVEINNEGTVSRNTTSFTSGKIPIRQVVCASGVQTVSTDKRAWFNINVHSGENIRNLSITATVAAKALTVAIKGEDGNDPSSLNVVYIKFRSSTLTDGKPVVRTITGALSVVLSSGSTLGFTAALAGRLYVWAIDNAGTVELALSRTADIFPEGNLVTTTAEGGTGSADSATIMYSTTARTNIACRCIGYVEVTTGAVAGEWDNAPTKIQIMSPGVKRTGDIIQQVSTFTGAVATGTGEIPLDNTIPAITEGTQYMTCVIAPTSALNVLKIDAELVGSHNATTAIIVALFQGSTTNAISSVMGQGTIDHMRPIMLSCRKVAGTTDSTTFQVRAGGNTGAGATMTFNGIGGVGYFNTLMSSSIIITEIFA